MGLTMSQLNKLSAGLVKAAGKGKYGDGGGLWLHKRDEIHGKWILLVTVYGRRREMGLGTLAEVSLRQARELGQKWRAVVLDGGDPIKERERQGRERARGQLSLSDATADAFESRKAELKGDGKAGRWLSPLNIHVLPKLGKVPVEDLDQIDIRDTLAPLWHTKAETARKAMNRLRIVLQHAAALGLDVDLQAVDKARALLGQTRQVSKNIPAVPWPEVPLFYQDLTDDSTTHLALRLLILTAVRSKPVRFLHESQIKDDVWEIDGAHMKGRKGKTPDFRVPLSAEAMNVIDLASKNARDGYLFPSVRKGVISDATMSRYMERLGLDARPHGFRSSFRDWADEATDVSESVAETALAHRVGGKVERAYLRNDKFERRRVLMDRWAQYVTAQSAEVVRIG